MLKKIDNYIKLFYYKFWCLKVYVKLRYYNFKYPNLYFDYTAKEVWDDHFGIK